MTFPRRLFLRLAAGAAAIPTVSGRGQTFPSQPVRIIVPTAASGPDDILTRLIGQWLSEHLSQPVIVENRPGAGTNTATEVVVRAPPDGYTLFSAGPASAINATLYDKLSFISQRHRTGRGCHAGIQRPGSASLVSREDGPRVHCLHQGQSGKTQHGIGWHWQRIPYGRRTVQDDGRR